VPRRCRVGNHPVAELVDLGRDRGLDPPFQRDRLDRCEEGPAEDQSVFHRRDDRVGAGDTGRAVRCLECARRRIGRALVHRRVLLHAQIRHDSGIPGETDLGQCERMDLRMVRSVVHLQRPARTVDDAHTSR